MNILMIHMESWDGRMLGCQNIHPAMKHATPAIDALAARGTRFATAYCTNPICCPSRANMLSGTYTHECESWNNFKGLETGMWTYDRELRKTYAVKLLGKHHDHLTGHHSVMNRVADMLEPLNVNGRPVMDCDAAQTIEVLPNRDKRCHKSDWKQFDEAAEFLRQRSESADDKPFFLCLNPGLVHAAFRTNEHWLETIPEALIDIPPLDITDHPANAYQLKAKGWRHGLDDETVRKVRRIYFAMCAEADAMIGELLATLDATDLTEDTTVIFTGDHGELAMEHQQYYKMSLFEGSVRIPMIMVGPGITPQQVIESPVSLIDIAPTICDLTGIHQRECFSGESLMPLARGETDKSRGWALASYSGLTTNTLSHMLCRDGYKLLVHEGYPTRLFNLAEDPDELNDVAEDQPERVALLEAILNAQVDREETLRVWEAYRRHAFAQFQRQAKRGLYWDSSYSLRGNPSSDYKTLMNNTFTGWDDEDEARVNQWLKGECP
ncbi:MAG: sulfatase-like hydrolase/transferase [Verrucomicrobia bacterium]|jgi:arylsulfatase K|nr:sulfatase-like hydrolase/transferase [Verrucomicrobiota bacterium]MBT7064895.1 sulfatase-like hydrolase/transferase [Verrucomicrobiota bacterium]MBT7699978.1 sulfatase-like hydrolase/transferase [Verrucomicrobiota bacterium]